MLAKGDVYLANLCTLDRNYGASKITDSDIMLKSLDGGDSFLMHGKTYISGRH